MKRFLVYLIKEYQAKLSPRLQPDCRFTPSCSHYAILALDRHNLIKAVSLIIVRILRCNPFTPRGTIDFP